MDYTNVSCFDVLRTMGDMLKGSGIPELRFQIITLMFAIVVILMLFYPMKLVLILLLVLLLIILIYRLMLKCAHVDAPKPSTSAPETVEDDSKVGQKINLSKISAALRR